MKKEGLTEADLREIEDRQRTLGDKAPRLAIAMLMLDVERLIAEVRRQAAILADFKEEAERCRAGNRLVMPSYIEKRT